MVVAPSLDAEATVKAFKSKHRMDDVAFLSDARPSARAYGVSGYPTAFVVDKSGNIAWRGHPMSPDFKAAIEKTLAK